MLSHQNMETSSRSSSSGSFASLALSVVLGFAVSFFAYLISNRLATPLRDIPGPFLASISQLWIVRKQRELQRPWVDLALHKKYGPIVRTGPREVIVSSPQSKRIIYGATSKFSKGDWYCATGDFGWAGDDTLDFLPELNMEKYKHQRRLVGGAYTAAFMKEVEGNLDEIMMKNIGFMKQRAGTSVNIDTFFDYFASDCIQAATLGKTMGFVEAGKDCGLIGFTHQFWFYMHWVGYYPIIHRTRLWYNNFAEPRINKLLALISGSKKSLASPEPKAEEEKPSGKVFDHMVTDWAEIEMKARFDRKEHPTNPTNIADRLLQIQTEKPALKTNWIQDMVTQNFNAGVETIGITVSTFLNFAMSHPGCQARLQKEIDEALAAGTLSRMPKLKELDNLPYLKACLSESRRLHPPLAHALARIVPEGGVELEGRWLPAGTTVGLNPWVLHRDKTLYGEDAEEYRPERWLEYSSEQLKALDATSMFFGSGARSCPGQYLAEAIFSKLIPLLLIELSWEYTYPGRERKIRSTFMTRLDNVYVQWKARI